MPSSTRAKVAWLLSAAALGPALVWLRTRSNGVNISPDSAAYLAAAEGIASGRGVVGVDDRAMSLYAPGLPSVLALPARWGVAEDAGRWLNLVLLALLVGLLGWWLSRIVRLPLAIGAAGLAAVSAPLLEVHSWLWSEPVYVLLVAVWLALLVRIVRAPDRALRLVVLAAGVAALATLVRYSGVALAPTAAIVLLARPGPLRRRVADCLLYGAAFAAPVATWLARNAVVTGEVTGERVPNAAGPWAIARTGLQTVGDWFAPAELTGRLHLLATALLVAAVVGLGGAVVRRWPPRSDERRAVLTVGGIFVICTFASMVVLASRTNVDPLSDRLLSPLVVPLLVVLVVALDVVLDGLPRRRAVALGTVALVCLGAASATSAVAGAELGGRGEPTYSSPTYRDDDVQALLAALPEERTTMSNQSRGLRYLTGSAVHDSPRRVHHASTVPVQEDIPRLRRLLGKGPVYLVWLGNEKHSRYHQTPGRLARNFELDEVTHTSAGVVYRVRCAPGGSCPAGGS
ncbi:hypothetical protein [Blastococcus sp. LR1]|uniref:hypothetical protein n=1 Tax=Blastococcus sp. LR1 TaxID=2877000 RepID=UPI001CCB6255|nr:hypothetical protein [Blastococcus sp. LR1]MCA0145077.1 hypothetical protein [Blastococcus sp. LR1]